MKNPIDKVKELSFSRVAGIDDATKCPCIGSIFVSGVVATPHIIRSWKKLGVKDSKLITASKRAKLEDIIKETACAYVIKEITPAMIDNKIYNLNDWEMIVVMQIIEKLQKSCPAQAIIIDNWEVSTELFHTRYTSLTQQEDTQVLFPYGIQIDTRHIHNVQLIAQHYADTHYTVVGAASILSKQSSDKQYVEYRKQFGDFGSGSPADPKTRLFVWQHRHDQLPIIRTSWSTYKALSVLEHIEDDAIYYRSLHSNKKTQLR
jgi:ribonuclease HII